MHRDLELIVSADEEARARVALAEQRGKSELGAARSARDAAIDARRNAASTALERAQRQQAEYLLTLAEAGERRFEEAVELYLRIVCEVSS